ncbi:uncharacterized protein Nmag_0239 [Natrialba magadii ATCC 43099]|uniref:HNH endonuclease n=2 Tax=Natrialba magadii TaxID=13769 RepID=D3SX11_NATMM|nr:uncharacterized protein Nmag_0239 [Natrialba magadii ATCC 43099]ELY33494.1 HNH endonuclease [Natrialba magadii ATCC 43099]
MIGSKTGDIVAAVRERDRCQCMNCYREEDEVAALDTHHIVPRSHGGSHRLGNLITLCRQCHNAAHGRTMAPRVRFYSLGQMDSDEFGVYREFFDKIDAARFDEEEKCWYIPLGDAQELLDEVGDDTVTDSEKVQAMNDAADFM